MTKISRHIILFQGLNVTKPIPIVFHMDILAISIFNVHSIAELEVDSKIGMYINSKMSFDTKMTRGRTVLPR